METQVSQDREEKSPVGIHLLLVEDSEDQAELICEVFRRHDARIEISWVQSAAAAIEELQERSFSLVLLDYSLPKMNGLELLIQMRERGCTVPAVMITGAGDERVAVQAMRNGVYDYIIKTTDNLATLPPVVEDAIARHQREERFLKSQEQYRILNGVSLSISTELKLEALAQKLVEGACRMVQAEMGALFVIDQEPFSILIEKTSGISFGSEFYEKGLNHWEVFRRLLRERRPLQFLFKEKPSTAMPPHDPPVRDLVLIPLLKQGAVKGVLLVANKYGGAEFDLEESYLLFTLALYARTVIENAQLMQETHLLAITDSLTGLYNHREFQRKLQEEVDRSERYRHEFSLLMLDIDHFKMFNDTYGHQIGDSVLKTIGRLIQEELRTINVPARYGGEEFAIVLPETPLKNARAVAERIRKKILNHHFQLADERETMVTVSIGVAVFPQDGERREELINAADEALYIAKELGRNSVYCHGDSLTWASGLEKTTHRISKEEQEILRPSNAGERIGQIRGHSEQVSRFALLLGNAAGLSEQRLEGLRIAGLLHDIGVLAIPNRVLQKIGQLTEEEKKIVQGHPGLAEMILRKAGQLEEVLPAILHHHERFDGSGYPDQLRGDKIPLFARILGIVDAYHAMISVRHYRERRTYQEVIEELRRNAGTQFDPDLVLLFIEALDK